MSIAHFILNTLQLQKTSHDILVILRLVDLMLSVGKEMVLVHALV